MSFQPGGSTNDINVELTTISRDAGLEATDKALQPNFEGILYLFPSISQIDFVQVSEATDPSQSIV
jgi:hypothetical protein